MGGLAFIPGKKYLILVHHLTDLTCPNMYLSQYFL